jgi:hypothetical protein
MKLSEEELCEEIHKLADEFGRPPTLQELRNYGEYAAMTYYNRFGSWQDAVEAAGYEPHEPNTRTPTTDLIEELKQVAKEYGEPPSAKQMDDHGEYWASTYRRRFGSWNAAIRAAGMNPVPENTAISEEELLSEIRRLREELGEYPTYRGMTEYGKYGAATYVRHFGSWEKAVKKAKINQED